MQQPALDQIIAQLQDAKDAWAASSVEARIERLRGCLRGTVAVGERQVAAGLRAKRIDPSSPVAGEEWLGGPVVTARNIRLLLGSLEDVAQSGVPRLSDRAVRTLADGQLAVQVFPRATVDRLLYQGFSAEVRMQPGVTAANLAQTMAVHYRERPPGRVCLVLGAGNVASIGPLDVIYKMFVEGQVCLLKMHPVNAYLGPFIEEAFAPLIRDGYLRLAYGGADVGAFLCAHDGVDEIHITGSDRTHDAIVFGVGPEAVGRKARGEPLNTKPLTSELGNVSPVIVVPGPWSHKELRFVAQNIATQIANNAGFNCNAAKVLITHERWPQRAALLEAIGDVLSELPPREAYYPGAEERFDRYVGAHPQARLFGTRAGERLPWALIPGIDAGAREDICFTSESWCGLMAETALAGDDAEAFLDAAARFCNETLWGTLSACVMVDPRTEKALAGPLERAVADLRYGSVVINHWPALSYGLGFTSWGAYPGHTIDDIQSGIGVVHNALMFDRPQKSVVRGPFVAAPKPPWFATHKRAHRVAPRLARLEGDASALSAVRRLPGIVANALLG